MSRGESKIYVGNLPPDVKEADIEDIFYKFGKITNVNLKCPTGQPPFAFVEFDDNRYKEISTAKLDRSFILSLYHCLSRSLSLSLICRYFVKIYITE